MVDEIAKRCSGSPLAATALGSVLRTKTSVTEWKAVLSSSSICTEETGILPILKLSYNDLPSHMKQCFAFCAVFPKDYKIDVDKLIQLWIANGFIPGHKENSLETSGKQIFSELASRSFFLPIEESKDFTYNCSKTTCKIHDLMHDIAMSVMEKECVVATLKPSETEWLPDTARHLFLSCGEPEDTLNDSMEKRSPAIQTLLCSSSIQSPLQHVSKYNSLRAIKLCTERESFLLKPRHLHHLRYLDLSRSHSIEALPEDISILYNLQVLDLSYCHHLGRLPRQMKYMTCLRHLYTHGCSALKSMPPELGKLTKLQTLTCFVAAVNGPDCSDVAELQQLNLGGRLELCQVENVIEAEAKVANLGRKKDIRELTLRWTSVNDSEVLKKFEPHDGLKVLTIHSYGGNCIGMLQNMVEIHLFKCERLQFLFRGNISFTFSKLKHLTLEHLLDFERWCEINEGPEEEITFPLLEKLFIRYCEKLIALPEAPLLQEPCIGRYRLVRTPLVQEPYIGGYRLVRTPFHQLEKLLIKYFGKFIALPKAQLIQEPCTGGFRSSFPALKVLELEALESFQRWGVTVGGEQILFPQLEKLSIQKCPKLIDLPEAPKLSVLEIKDCKKEIFHWVDGYISSLAKLILELEKTETTSEAECTMIVPVDSKEKWNQKSPLTFMALTRCYSLFGSGAREPWDCFVHLEELQIDTCDVLVHWPEKVFQCLVSLKRLLIKNCKNLIGYVEAPLEPSESERSKHLPGLDFLGLEYCPSLVEMFNVPESLKVMRIFLCPQLESIYGKQQQGMLSSSPMNHFCPCLERLSICKCDGLSGVLHLPPSLKTVLIMECSSIQVLSCQLDRLHKPQVTTSTNVPEPSAEHSLPPYLESLEILFCAGMLRGILHLPTSLTKLEIEKFSGLTSLEFPSGEPPSLVALRLVDCSILASLPNEQKAYGSLQWLYIIGCPAIKKLPRCLQQQLGRIDIKYLDAQYEATEFKPLEPKTWKEIPRLVRERRQANRI